MAITPKNASSAIPELQQYLGSVQDWMAASKLKLNPDKTEFIIFGTPAQQDSLSPFYPVDILGSLIHPSDCVRHLGILFDSGLLFTKQINSLRKSCYFQMHDFVRIRRFLTNQFQLRWLMRWWVVALTIVIHF